MAKKPIRVEYEAGAEIHCLAPHPLAGRIQRFRKNTHGALMPLRPPARVRFTGRILTRLEDVRDGCLGVQCGTPDCRAVMELEFVDTFKEEAA